MGTRTGRMALLGAWLILAGCGGKASTGDDVLRDAVDAADPAADVPAEAVDAPTDTAVDLPDDVAPDPGGDASTDARDGIAWEDPIVLLEKKWTGTADGPVDGDPILPFGQVRVSDCGDVGVLFRDVQRNADGTFETALVVQVFAGAGPSAPPREYLATGTKTASPLSMGGSLVFAPASDLCAPRVWRASDTRPGIDLWTRTQSGTWTALDVPLGLEKVLGAAAKRVVVATAATDREGTLHLLIDAAATADGATRRFHAWPVSGAWSLAEIPPFPGDLDCRGLAFDTVQPDLSAPLFAACTRAGAIVLAGAKNESWETTEVTAPKDGSEDIARTVLGFAIGGYGTPVIAYSRRSVVEPYTVNWSRLEVATRGNDGAWKFEIVATQRDEPSNPLRLTGEWPQVFIQGSGGGELAFADLVDAGPELGREGQVVVPARPRHASRGTGGWRIDTVLRQPLQPQDGKRRVLFGPTLPAASTGGDILAFLVRERERPAVAAAGEDVESILRLILVRASR